MRPKRIRTPHGAARAHIHAAGDPTAVLVLGHGAGGGVVAPDLVGVTKACTARGISVVLVEQPYRVAGRRSPAPVAQLDAAWIAVVERLDFPGLPLYCGGRSSGARVACRTAAATQAAAVVCLAFPVHPPGRPEKSRLDELDAVKVPVLVVQGERDPFGMPPRRRGRKLIVVEGDHSLRRGVAAYSEAVADWLVSRHAT
jgi:predicted alpha/beta-hydrolase family hydrolase